MNKEFKKLLEQSYTKGFEECARTGHKVGDLDVIFNSIVMEEFAELIVRECVDWIDGSPSTDAGQLVLTKSFIIANIKDHFGVEE